MPGIDRRAFLQGTGLLAASTVATKLHAYTSEFGPLVATKKTHRVTLSLNGEWDVEDSVGADEIPKSYNHRVPVPGLTHSAVPTFVDVDQYQSRQLLSNLTRQGRYSKTDYEKLGDVRGISHQQRNYFWYRRTFQGPAQDAVALLKMNKAQFSTVVYLNGVRIGEHDPCFIAAYFNATHTIHWNAPNFCADATFAQLKPEVSNAIVDNALGGYLPPYHIPETRPAKPSGS